MYKFQIPPICTAAQRWQGMDWRFCHNDERKNFNWSFISEKRFLLHDNVFRQLQCGWSECCSLSVLLTCTPIAPDSLGKQFKFKKILKINFLTDWSQMTDIWLMPCGRSQSGSGITRSLFSTNSSSQLCTIRSISGCALCAPLLKRCDSLRILQWGRSSVK